MTVHGQNIADRLRSLEIDNPGVDALLEQLGPQMTDSNYRAIAVAIVRLLTRSSGKPAARSGAVSGLEASRVAGSTRPP
jgi:hypothetical protein